MRRYLAGRPVTLSHRFLSDDDGPPAQPDSVAVSVLRDGDVSPSASGPATGNPDGVYTFTTKALPEGVYTATWTAGDTADLTSFEVVGDVLFSVAYARQADSELTAARFPADAVRAQRDVVEAEFERIAGRSFTPRTAYIPRSSLPGDVVLLPRIDVRSVAILGPSGAPLGGGTVERIGPFGPDGETGYAYLSDIPDEATGFRIAYGMRVPAEIRRVGVIRLRWLLTAERSGIPDRATSFQPAEGGTYTLATPGRAGYETGIPDVDAAVLRYRLTLANSVVVA